MIFSSFFSWILFRTYGLLHPIRKKVVFTCFFGKQYSGNPRAISEAMHRLYPDYEQVWLLNKKNMDFVPDYVRIVYKDDRFFAWGREIATSASYVYNVELHTKMYRKKGQSFIQTWHGDRGFKKILKDRNENLVLYDDQLTTLCVSGSEWGTQIYRSAFGYTGEIVEIGSPRNDCLFYTDEKRQQEIRRRLGVPADCKILLYAPTFRDNNKQILQESNIDLVSVLNVFPEHEKWICLIRAHVAAAGIRDVADIRIYNVTAYPDMADILCITDFLITDYSSCAPDFAITEKPVVLALFDKEQYRKECRDFYYEPEQAGFIVAYNQEELEKIIRTTTKEQYVEACRNANRFYGIKESGHAAEIVCQYIDDHYKKNH